jgi:group I intron endonuclease
MTSEIYLITNKINGHMYVGGSIDIERRFDEHKRYRDLKNSAVDRAIKKYGKENYKKGE